MSRFLSFLGVFIPLWVKHKRLWKFTGENNPAKVWLWLKLGADPNLRYGGVPYLFSPQIPIERALASACYGVKDKKGQDLLILRLMLRHGGRLDTFEADGKIKKDCQHYFSTLPLWVIFHSGTPHLSTTLEHLFKILLLSREPVSPDKLNGLLSALRNQGVDTLNTQTLRYLFKGGPKETLLEAIRLFSPLGHSAVTGLLAANRIDFAELLVNEKIDWSEVEEMVNPWYNQSAFEEFRRKHEASRLRSNTQHATSVSVRARL